MRNDSRQIGKAQKKLRSWLLLCVCALLLLALPNYLFGQTGQLNPLTPLDPLGVVPGASVEGNNESITLSNGGIYLFLPVLSLPQRGSNQLTLAYMANSLRYHYHESMNVSQMGTDEGGSYDCGIASCYDVIMYTPAIESATGDILNINLPTLTANVEYMGDLATPIGPLFCVTGWVFTDWTGASHSFGNAVSSCIQPGIYSNGGKQYDSVDGSFMRLDVSNANDYRVIAKDGSVYHFANTGSLPNIYPQNPSFNSEESYSAVFSSLVDPNGNTLSVSPILSTYQNPGYYTGFTLVDTLGRTITINQNSISYLDSNGATQTITLQTNPHSSNNSYLNSFPDAADSGLPPYNPTSEYNQSYIAGDWSDPWIKGFVAQGTITTVTIPAGSSPKIYTLETDDLLRPRKVTYPEGGYTRYDYQNFPVVVTPPTSEFTASSDSEQIAHRYECKKSEGNCSPSEEDVTAYVPIRNAEVYLDNPLLSPMNNLQIDVIDALGNKTHHEFAYVPAPDCTPHEVSTVFYDPNGIKLKSVATSFPSYTPTTSTEYMLAGNTYVHTMVQPISTSTTFYDASGGAGATSTINYTWDTETGLYYDGLGYSASPVVNSTSASIDNLLTEDDYGYSGEHLKSTANVWMHNGQFESNTGHILNRLSSATDSDPVAGQSIKSYTYDTKGNMLTSAVSGTGSATYTTQFQQLDSYGRAQQITDAAGSVWHYSYGNNWGDSTCSGNVTGNAFLTQAQDPAGNKTTYAYNSCTGTLSSKTDTNNQTTAYAYDAAGRLTASCTPDELQALWSGGSCTSLQAALAIQYQDAAPVSITSTKRSGAQSPLQISQGIVDGFGQLIQTLQSDPFGTMIVDKTYDPIGRLSSVSNPYRSHAESTYGLTEFTYDALNRKTATINPDGSRQDVAFSENYVKSMDEGNGSTRVTRIAQNDALGKIVSSCEVSGQLSVGATQSSTSCGDPWSSSGFLTQYQYDQFSDLTQVVQPGLSNRVFTYDGLARLLTSSNPEAGIITYSYTASGSSVCAADPSALCLQTKNDGTRIAYSYDNVGRLIGKSYSPGGSTGSTQSVGYVYQDGSGTVANNANGRLIKEFTGSLSTPTSQTAITGYDAMGRVLSQTQCFLANCTSGGFNVLTSHDWLGNITSLTNGIGDPGILLTYQYDSANRLQSLASSWDDPQHPGVLFQASTPLVYSSHLATDNSNVVAPYGPFGLQSAQIAISTQSNTAALNMIRAYDKRGRSISEADLGASQAGAAGTSQGSIDIEGVETALFPRQFLEAVTITGDDLYNTGTVSLTVNGITDTYSYTGTYPTVGDPVAVADGLTQAINDDAFSQVTAENLGSVISLYTKSSAIQSYSVSSSETSQDTSAAYFSITVPSSTATPTYTNPGRYFDKGTINVSINGTISATSWGENANPQCIASSLATALQSSAGSFLTASASGSAIQLNSLQASSASNWPVQISLLDTMDPSSPSFHVTAAGMSGGSSVTGQNGVVYSYSLEDGGYAPDGNVLSFNDSVIGQWSAGYDAMNRMTSASATGGLYQGLNISWAMDNLGNRWSETYSGTASATVPTSSTAMYGSTNRLTGSSMGVMSYSGNGEVIGDNANNYIYDAEGRVCAVQSKLNGVDTAYIYDAEGTRVAKGTITSFNCDESSNGFSMTNGYVLDPSGRQMSEVDGSGKWVHTNVFANGDLLATYSSSTAYPLVFAFNDWLGTKRAEALPNGTLCGTDQSLPFGGGLAANGPCNDATEQHFTGKERDQESGLDYFGARYYGSSFGRLMSPDWSAKQDPVPYAKLDNPQSLNLYSYVLNNPLSNVDPDGHDCNGKDTSTCQITNTQITQNVNFYNKAGDVISSVKVTTNMTVISDSNTGAVSSVSASATATNVSGLKFNDSQLSTIGSTVASVQQAGASMSLGADSAHLLTAITAKESSLGIASPSNPLQLAGSSGNRPNGDPGHNIQGALDVLQRVGQRSDFDPASTYHRYNGVPGAQGVTNVTNFMQIYNGMSQSTYSFSPNPTPRPPLPPGLQ